MSKTAEPQAYKSVSKFDLVVGALVGRPDVVSTKPSTLTHASPFIGGVQTFIIQTHRERERGDTILVQYITSEGTVQVPIPPEASEIIARQRDALTARVRRRNGKENAAARKARGELPGFMRGKKS